MTQKKAYFLHFIGTKLTLFFISTVVIFGFSACQKTIIGSGPIVSQTYTTGNFNGVDVQLNATVHISQGATTQVDVDAQQNILDNLSISVSSGKLIIREKKSTNILDSKGITVHIVTPDIQNLNLDGSGHIYLADVHVNHAMSLDIDGSGKIDTDSIDATSLQCSISGSGDLAIQSCITQTIQSDISGSGSTTIFYGACTNSQSEISGSGQYNAVGVESQFVNTTTSGSGKTTLWFVKTLHATISGSGDVYYKGDGSISQNISGSGKLIKL